MLLVRFVLFSLLFTNYKPIEPLSIEGPAYFEVKYYDLIREEEFIKNFKIFGYAENFCFIPSLNFNLLGERNYLLHIENNTYFCEKEFTMNVIDDLSPSIKGPEVIYLKKEPYFDIESLLCFYKGIDDFDGQIDVHISEFNKEMLFEKKECDLELYCEDNSKNIAYKKVKILLEDKEYGLYIKQNMTIDLEKGNYYSPKDIIRILIAKDYLENVTNINAYYIDSGQLNFNRCGKYKTIIVLESSDIGYEINLIINVIEPLIQKKTIINLIIDFLNDFIMGIRKKFYAE